MEMVTSSENALACKPATGASKVATGSEEIGLAEMVASSGAATGEA